MAFISTKRKGRVGGFTLVEVIVVLVILAILAALVVPSMTGWIDSARQKRLVVACRTCVTAAQTIASENYGKYRAQIQLPSIRRPARRFSSSLALTPRRARL